MLDVGCGMGRFAEVATRWGAHVVGIDLSLAAEVAEENLKGRQAVFFQADVFKLPFAPESFDYIYSLGVLHHTPDCKAAFQVLPGLLKPGGRIAIWLYSRYNNWYKMSDIYRKVTRRMSPKLLHKLCYGVIPLYGIHQVLRKIPLVGRPASGAAGLHDSDGARSRSAGGGFWIPLTGTRPGTSPSTLTKKYSAGLRSAGWKTCGSFCSRFR